MVVAGVVVLEVVGVGVVVVMVRMVGSGGGRNGNDRSGTTTTTTTFPLLSLSRLEGSLCIEGASFQFKASPLCMLSTSLRNRWSAPFKPICQ